MKKIKVNNMTENSATEMPYNSLGFGTNGIKPISKKIIITVKDKEITISGMPTPFVAIFLR